MTTNDNMELRIREVAQQLFFEQGYAATSTTQIAKEVGCTQALVHYYYRTKENLFRQIFLEQVLAALNVIGRSLANEESFDRFIEQAISMYFDALSSNPRLPYFVLEELVTTPSAASTCGKNSSRIPLMRCSICSLTHVSSRSSKRDILPKSTPLI